MALTIGIDVGGTKIAGGVVDEDGHILEMLRKPTPAADPEAAVNAIIDVTQELLTKYEVTAVGIGAPGFIDSSRSSIIFAPNVSWANEPLALKVSTAIGLPVNLENDANAAAWGEYKFGAAKNRRSAIIVTVGTGIGGGIINDGVLLRGSFGFGAEIGHMNLVPSGVPCGCGERGCWEMYSSGSALVRIARERAEKSPNAASRLLEIAGGDAKSINGKQITKAAQEGDEFARECFGEIANWLGQGMADLATILDPEMFVISGGVSDAGDLLLEPTKESFATKLTARTFRPLATIALAQLGNDAGLIGAANLALQAYRV